MAASNTSAPAQRPVLARGFTVSSPAFRDQGAIPAKYTCKGADVSLPLTISGVPPSAKELVVAMRDPDASSGNFVHWALAGIPPSTHAIQSGGVPGLVAPGRNSYGTLGYRGPCPPTAQTHHYVITVTALGAPSGLRPGFTLDSLHTPAVALATLTGTFKG